MDITIVTGDLYDLPTSMRSEAIAHGGAADLRLWPGAGQDRVLLYEYGAPELKALLDATREKEERVPLEPGRIVRLHPGKLRADTLLWIVMHEPERNGELSPAPPRELIERAVEAAIRYAAEREWTRVAFPPLGWGPGELPAPERMAIIARTAQRYADECFASGRDPVIEHVYVVSIDGGIAAAARRLVGSLAKAENARDHEPKATPERSATTPSSAAPRAKRAPSPGGQARPVRHVTLDAGAIEAARATASAYDPSHVYQDGEWMQHKHFGVGQVQQITPDGFAMVLFEDRQVRRLLAGRPR